MKENLIRVKDYKNLFYDKVEKTYRVRMHCPECDKVSGCRCFKTRREAEIFLEDGISCACSKFCELLLSEYDIEDIGSIMKEMDTECIITIKSRVMRTIVKLSNFFTIWRLKWYIFKYFGYISESDASEVVDQMDIDYDYMEGESC